VKRPGNKDIIDILATVGGMGRIRYAPGTISSAAGLLLCLLIHRFLFIYASVFIILFLMGVWTSGIYAKRSGRKDPGEVVIDEFSSVFLVYLFIPDKNMGPLTVISGFILFRFFDISKVPPVGIMEKFKGGWGIMLDDLMSALLSALILIFLNFLSQFF
jgi:phosphatidylglycerophosphatase A